MTVIAYNKEEDFKQDLSLQMQASAYPHMNKEGQKKMRDFVKPKNKKKQTPEEERASLLKLKELLQSKHV